MAIARFARGGATHWRRVGALGAERTGRCLADALIGTALLYFAWGRGDYPTDLEKFLARVEWGRGRRGYAAWRDSPLALWELLAVRALRDFTYRGFTRWFPPVFYFWLLGPFAAAAYRLTELSNTRAEGRFDAALALLDWLPSRLLLLSFAVLGDFERTRTVLTSDAFDQSVANEVLLATGVERAGPLI